MKAKTKKIILAAAAAVLVVVIVLCAVLIPRYTEKGDISGTADTAENYYNRMLPQFHTEEDGSFRIVQISDTHLTTGQTKKDLTVLANLEKVITEYTPALIVVAGDMIDDGGSGTFNKKQALDTVAQLFEQHNQYWAYIPGNNDGINYGTSADVCAYLSQYEHCMVTNQKGVTGGAQYSLDIYNKDALVHSLLFLDTNDYDNESEDYVYGYLHTDQIEWADREIAAKKELNPQIRTSVFLHENTPAFFKAAKKGSELGGKYAAISESEEKYNIPKNEPLDNILNEYNCTGLVSMGHKHPEKNECSLMNDVYYHITATAQTAASMITIQTGAQSTADMYQFTYIEF